MFCDLAHLVPKVIYLPFKGTKLMSTCFFGHCDQKNWCGFTLYMIWYFFLVKKNSKTWVQTKKKRNIQACFYNVNVLNKHDKKRIINTRIRHGYRIRNFIVNIQPKHSITIISSWLVSRRGFKRQRPET